MPKRTIDFVIDIFESLRRQGIQADCPRAELVKAIEILAGASPRTIERYLGFLERHGFAVPTSPSADTYSLNYDEVYRLML